MTPLRRTEPTAGADELRGRIAEDGYVFLPGLLPQAAVQRVRRDVISVLEQEGWIAPGTDPDDLVPGPHACLEGRPTYFGAYRRILALQSLNELAHHPATTAVVSALVDGPLVVHPRKIARASQPQTDEYTPAHQDFRLVQGTPDTFTTWVPLTDCPTDLGGLRVLAGSPKLGLLRVQAGGHGGFVTEGVADSDPEWRTSDYKVGDVILFHSLTVHGAMPNRTKRMRLSVDFRYQSALEPVAGPSLLPHYYGHATAGLPGWDGLTGDWTSRASISTPLPLVEVEMGDPWSNELEVVPRPPK